MFMAGFIPTGCISCPAASNEAAAFMTAHKAAASLLAAGPDMPGPWAVPRTPKAEAHRLSEGALRVVARSNAARGTFCGETVYV